MGVRQYIKERYFTSNSNSISGILFGSRSVRDLEAGLIGLKYYAFKWGPVPQTASSPGDKICKGG